MQSRCQKATDSNNPKIHAADLRESGGGVRLPDETTLCGANFLEVTKKASANAIADVSRGESTTLIDMDEI